MAIGGSILVDLIANTGSFDTDIRKSAQKLNSAATQMQKDLQRLNAGFSLIKNSAIGFLAGFGVEFTLGGAKALLDYADDLGTAADQAGIAVERFQTLREGFRALELGPEKFEMAMKRLLTTLGEVQDGTENGATKALAKMGITAKVLSGEISSTDELLDAITSSSKSLGSEAQYTAALVDIFGKKLGVDLAAATRDGGAALKEQEQAFRDAGHVIDESYIQQLADANEAVDAFVSSTTNDIVIWAAKFINAFDEVEGYLDNLEFKLERALGMDTSDIAGRINRRVARQFMPAIDQTMKFAQALVPGVGATDKPEAKPPEEKPKKTGGGSRSGRSGGAGKSSNDAAAKLVADTKAFNEEIRNQIELLTLRNDGFTYAADLLEAQLEVERRFPQQAKETNDAYRARIAPLIATRTELLNASEAAKQLTFDLNDGLSLSGETQARIGFEWRKTLKGLGIDTEDTTEKISDNFADMASNINQALTSLSSGIRSGGFLDIFGGLLNLGAQLGSAGLFGKSFQTKIKDFKGFSFSSGGYTGSFGVNDVAGVVHGQEYVFDAAAVRRIGLPALEALRAGQIPGYKSGGFVGSSSVGRYINRAGVNDNALRVQVVKGDLFDVIVDGRAASVAAPMVVAGSQAASAGAQKAVAKRSTRRLA